MRWRSPAKPNSEEPPIPGLFRFKVNLYCAIVAVACLLFLTWSARTLSASKTESHARNLSRVNPNVPDRGLTAFNQVPPARPDALKVTVGCYLDRIVALSIKDGTWTADFYLWFTWKGRKFDPSGSLVVVDGTISEISKKTQYDRGDQHYVLYHVQATISKNFDTLRFPVDDHQLSIEVEIAGENYESLQLIADPESTYSSRVFVPAYEISLSKALSKPHSYKSRRGDPRIAVGATSTYSQFRYVIEIQRPDWGIYVKLFLGLFVAVLVAVLSFFIRPTDLDPRFGLGIGALFAAVANTYVTASLVPDVTAFTLADLINSFGIFIIFVVMLQSTISLRWYDSRGEKAASQLFDRRAFRTIGVIYILVNLLLPILANSW